MSWWLDGGAVTKGTTGWGLGWGKSDRRWVMNDFSVGVGGATWCVILASM